MSCPYVGSDESCDRAVEVVNHAGCVITTSGVFSFSFKVVDS